MAALGVDRQHTFAWAPALLLALAAAGACGGDSLMLPQDGEPAALVVLGGDGQVDTVGHPLRDSLIVRITDHGDRPIRYQPVRFLPDQGTIGARIIPDVPETDADGRARALWVLGTVAGPQTIQARVVRPGGELTAEFHAAAVAAAPDTVQRSSGNAQAGVVGSALAQPLVALVTDRYGNPVSGVTTTWSVVGGGSVTPTTSVSGSDGLVTARRTLGPSPGAQQTIVSAPGLKGSPLGFVQTANLGQPARLIAESGDGQSGMPGQPLASPLVVRLVDALGNAIAGQAVTWPVATGGGAISAAGLTTDAGGRASATWTLGPVAGANVVVPSSGGFTATFTATSNPTQPTAIAANTPVQFTGTAGAAANPAPSVRVTDAQGRPVSGVVVDFAVTGGAGSVVPMTASTDLNGDATVGLWTLGPQAGTNILSASASSGNAALNGSPVLFTAVATAGLMSRLAIVVQPSPAGVSGVPLAQAPTVQLQDANGNDVSGSGVVVTATIAGSPPGASLASAVATTNAGGSVTFTGLTLTAPTGTYTLLFTSSPQLTGATSGSIALSGALAPQLALVTQPSATVSSGQIFPRQPVLQALDASGNPLGQSGIVCSVALASGSPALGGTLTVTTDAAGVATFTDLSISGVAGLRTLQFSAIGLTPVTSNTIDVQAGGPTLSISLVVQPSSSVANGATFPVQPSVLVLDQSGLPVSGASVSAAVASAGATLGGQTTTTTNSLGIATFSTLSLTGTVGGYALTISAGASSVTTSAINLTPGPASASQSTAIVPSRGNANRQTVITVQTRDQSGNDLLMGGHTVEITVTGKNKAGPLTAGDNGDGTYTASYTPTRKGNDFVAITLDGVPIGGSPYLSDVH